MGGHGGLNILPQKRWNVYNFDNREKVKRDEEAAAREDQLRLEQSRRAEADLRLQTLRRARGIAKESSSDASDARPAAADADAGGGAGGEDKEEAAAAPDDGHINLFHNLAGFGFLGSDEHAQKRKAKREESASSHKKDHKRRREEKDKDKAKEAKVITAEEEKYRLGYGLAGKGVKRPWYLARPDSYDALEGDKEVRSSEGKGKKKSIEELREERRARERTEKERERKLIASTGRRGFSR